MALQFNTLSALITDLESKAGIYAAHQGEETIVYEFAGQKRVYDLPVTKIIVDDDGTQRYPGATQQVVEDLTDNTFGYGSNRQWDLKDDSVTTFTEEASAHASSFEGTTIGSATIIKVKVDDVDEDRRMALATAYMSDNTTINAVLYKDSNDTWQELQYA